METKTYRRWGGTGHAPWQGPTYRRAPVIETSLAVRFATPANWNIHVFGLLRERLADRFQIFETAPSLVFAEAGKIQVSLGLPRVRGLYWSESRDRLIQLQDDLFCMNWQKTASEDYPRYDALRKQFIQEWDLFATLTAKIGLSPFALSGCSMTYINRIDENLQLSPPDLSAFVTEIPESLSTLGLKPTALTTSLVLAKGSEQVTYTVQPAIQLANNVRVTHLTLVSESKTISPDGSDLLSRLDDAHKLLIETFEALTSDHAKQEWQKEGT